MALLFVVSLILFITLLGTSFVVVSQQFSASAKNRARIEATGDSSRAYVYRAFYDLVRGPEVTNANSPLLGHDLLSDLYGYGISANIAGAVDASAATGIPGTIEFTLANTANLAPGGGAFAIAPGTRFDVASLFNGQVLTFTDGELRGSSVRVIGYSGSNVGLATGLPYSFLVYQTQSTNSVAAPAVLNGDRIVLNGRAYSGFGAGGVNPGAGMNYLNAVALLPNLTAGVAAAVYTSTGVNEPYDASDYQNMFLASIDPVGGLKASFDDANLYVNQGNAAGANFRAFGEPGDALQVDNDGDGNPDGIWMDLGYPIQTDKDGRRYKTLVSYLVLDMDSRLNINAHGNLNQLDVVNNATGTPGADGLPDVSGLEVPLLGAHSPLPPGSMQANFGFAGPPRGQFLGPPEVNLAPLFDTGAAYGQLLVSRYGADGRPGVGLARDSWSTVSLYGHPDGTAAFNNNRFVGGYYGTAMDVFGRFGVGIPNVPNGATPILRPQLDLNSTFTIGDEITDSPYEFSLIPESRYLTNGTMSDDRPFTPQELERILRLNDRDVKMLPSRIWDIAASNGINPMGLRNAITTESYEVPAVPMFEPEPALGEAVGVPVSVPERVYNLLVFNGVAPAAANVAMEDLVSFDVRMGLPFDINRPFGDSADQNGNGTIDEAAVSSLNANDPAVNEPNIGEQVVHVNGAVRPFDGNGDGLSDNFDYLARYEFAKHLYILALLATGDTAAVPPVPAVRADYDPLPTDTIRRINLAQWVVNVVDFRDCDSISTPFEIDFNPFDGWQPDGDPSTPDATFTVWGAERPELLINETMATHDRRMEDDGSGTFRNELVPRAAAFFELYHPWNQNGDNQLMPAEWMDAGRNGIDIRRTTTTGEPVWRMVVVRDMALQQEGPERVEFAEADIARRIYFVQPDLTNASADSLGGGTAFQGEKVYFPSAAVATDGVITPGGYAVIGSGGVGTGVGPGEVLFGQRSDDPTQIATTRRIILDNASRTVTAYDPVGPTTLTRNDVVAIPIDQYAPGGTATDRSLGLSDPDGGYPGTKTETLDGFQFDTPNASTADTDPFALIDGTSDGFRRVLLQRLANPLEPWNAVANPYITVDWHSVDLTAFNGVEDDSADPNVTPSANPPLFATFERDRWTDPLYVPLPDYRFRRFLWTVPEPGAGLPPTNPVPFATLAGADNHVYSFELHESLGTINDGANDTLPRTASELTLGANAPLGYANLPFNNRPYSGHFDLLDVSYCCSLDMLENFFCDVQNSVTDPYSDTPQSSRQRHLLNFFAELEAPLGQFPSGMHAVLDFLRVPSRFPGTDIHLTDSATLLPPFDLLSRYRVPGKVNMNTAVHQNGGELTALQGVLGEFFRGFGVNGQNVDGSVAAFTQTPFNQVNFNGSRRSAPGPLSPTRFDNPFRFSLNYNKVPTNALVPVNGATPSPVQASLLRTDPSLSNEPLFEVNSDLPSAHSLRDSWVRHSGFRKIANTTTNRSSVFSIWVTVGRFEVDENDNLTGDELGFDTGRIERSRGFFMIDRSIPVGFEPGKNHNIENMILTETIIQ